MKMKIEKIDTLGNPIEKGNVIQFISGSENEHKLAVVQGFMEKNADRTGNKPVTKIRAVYVRMGRTGSTKVRNIFGLEMNKVTVIPLDLLNPESNDVHKKLLYYVKVLNK